MGTMSDHGLSSNSTPSDHGIDPADFGGGGGIISTPNDGELHLTPKASSTGVEGTVFYDSYDDHLWVATG